MWYFKGEEAVLTELKTAFNFLIEIFLKKIISKLIEEIITKIN